MIFRGVYLFTGNKNLPSLVTHHTLLEGVWTVIPTIILIFMAIPACTLLTKMDTLEPDHVYFKAIGNQ